MMYLETNENPVYEAPEAIQLLVRNDLALVDSVLMKTGIIDPRVNPLDIVTDIVLGLIKGKTLNIAQYDAVLDAFHFAELDLSFNEVQTMFTGVGTELQNVLENLNHQCGVYRYEWEPHYSNAFYIILRRTDIPRKLDYYGER